MDCMFKKIAKQGGDIQFDDVETIIGPSVKLEGEFQSKGNVMVSGVLIGKLETSENVRIETNAQIDGDITAREAIIAGNVHGNIIIAQHLSLLSSAKITGDITAGSIAIQQGAQMNGKCSMVATVEPKPADVKQNAASVMQDTTELL